MSTYKYEMAKCRVTLFWQIVWIIGTNTRDVIIIKRVVLEKGTLGGVNPIKLKNM